MDNHDDTVVLPDLQSLTTGVYQRALVVNAQGEVEEALVRRIEHSQRYPQTPLRLGVRQALA